MITRYDLMSESTQIDIDNDSFPDPLSLNYNDILNSKDFSIPPLQYEIDELFIKKPYMYIYTYYSNKPILKIIDSKGNVFLDDIILDINNIKHKDYLKEGEIIYFPDAEELQAYISSRMRNK